MPDRIIVASTNPVKIEAVRLGFATWILDEEINVSDIGVPSGIHAVLFALAPALDSYL